MAIKISVDVDELKKSSTVDLIRCISDIDIDCDLWAKNAKGLLWDIRKPIETEVCHRLNIEKVNQFPCNGEKVYDGKAIYDMAEQWDAENESP